jgi:hypothetical protein
MSKKEKKQLVVDASKATPNRYETLEIEEELPLPGSSVKSSTDMAELKSLLLDMRRDIARLEERTALQEDWRERYLKEKDQEESEDESVVDIEKDSVAEPEPSTRQSSVVTQIFQAMNLKQPLLLETTKPSIKKFLLEFKRYRLKYKTQMKEDDVIQDCVDPSSLENMTFMLGIDVSILLNQSRGFS